MSGSTNRLNGPSSACHNEIKGYEVESSDCFIGITDIQVVGGYVVTQPVIGNPNFFEIRWTNNGSSLTQGTVTVKYNVFSGSCPSQNIPPSVQKTVSKQVSIEPGNLAAPTPTAIVDSFVYSEDPTGQASAYYSFSTSATGADDFVWSVTGGLISEDNQNNIKVQPNTSSCQIVAKVRTKKISCSSQTTYSNWVEKTINLSRPSNPGSISGQTIIPSGGSRTFSVPEATNATNYSWRLVGSSAFSISPALSINGGPGTAPNGTSVSVKYEGTSSLLTATLYVRPQNSCYQSLEERSILLHGQSPIILSSSDLIISPNPSKGNRTINVLLPETEIVEFADIKNFAGETVRVINPQSIETIDLNGLDEGVYFLHYSILGIRKSKRFIVSH